MFARSRPAAEQPGIGEGDRDELQMTSQAMMASAPCAKAAGERRLRIRRSLPTGGPLAYVVEAVVGEFTADGGGLGLVECLQVAREVLLHLLVEYADDVAAWYGRISDSHVA